MIKINFLPEPDRSLSLKRLIFISASTGFGAIIVFWVSFAVSSYWNLDLLKEESASLSQRLNVIKQQNKELRELEETLNKLTKLAEDIHNLKASQFGVSKFLIDLATKVPEKVWFREFAFGGLKYEIKGYALSDQDLADFQRALQSLPYSKTVELIKSQTTYLFKNFAFDSVTRELFMDVSDLQHQSQFFNFISNSAKERGLAVFKKPPPQSLLQTAEMVEKSIAWKPLSGASEIGVFIWSKPESLEAKQFELRGEIFFSFSNINLREN